MKIHNELLKLRQKEKEITSEILEKLQIIENNRGYLSLGYSSLFDYLNRGLGYSKSRAYERQSCLRLSRELPEIKEKIDQGKLSYSTVTMAYKSIKNKSTFEKRQVLKCLENKSTREVKKLLLEPAKPIQIKKTEYQDKVVLRLELSHEQNKKIEKLKALKSHSGGFEVLLEKLLDQELQKFENTGFKPSLSKNARFIAKTLRNSLLKEAQFKCQYPGCEETHYLQVDHIVPVRRAGKASRENLQILCGAHNRYKA